ncbi:MAG: aldehyde reductase [bacterium]|nr:aldehyde reductase [bacterium]
MSAASSAPAASAPATVLVTGATGYIAGWLVKYLLDAGHNVHATVRNPARATHLQKLADGSKGTLTLFKADLLTPGSFDEAMQGCSVVMHTASPFVLDGFTDAYEALVRPAVEGTRNVLEAVQRTESVKRVVLTSSAASVHGDNKEILHKAGGRFDESDWNTTSSVDHNPYQYSKVAAEREAWKMQKGQSRWDLVTINPVMVYGPSLTPASHSASIDTLVQMGDGRLRTGVPDLSFGVVDVREVARAHVLAAFTPAASGRYILYNKTLSMLKIAGILRTRFGGRYPFPRMQIPKFMVWLVGPLMGPVTRDFITRNVGYTVQFDNRHSQELGIRYRPVEETFGEHFQQILDDGLVKKRG